MKDKGALVALNGELTAEPSAYFPYINDFKPVIAADGGALLLDKLGIKPDVVVGDLDSLSKKYILELKKTGIKIEQYPQEKNETDGELALYYCLQRGYKSIAIVGALGGRYDQQLANVYLLEFFLKHGGEAEIKEPGLEIGLIDDEKEFVGCRNCRFSLLPLTVRVQGVKNSGFKYSLRGEEMVRYKTRGISNIITEEKAKVSVGQGLLIYMVYKNNLTSG